MILEKANIYRSAAFILLRRVAGGGNKGHTPTHRHTHAHTHTNRMREGERGRERVMTEMRSIDREIDVEKLNG